MILTVRGIGWVSKTGFGSVRAGENHSFASGEGIHSLAKRGIFSHPFKNFGRLDGISRLTVSAVALALRDAGIGYSPTGKQNMGIIATSSDGSLTSDTAYFRDFVENGRTTSRANLFIYTLPSSAPSEAAIHFGMTGPLLYAGGENDSFVELLDMAAEMVVAREAEFMLVGKTGGEESLYIVLDGGQHENVLCRLHEARLIVATAHDSSDILSQISALKIKEGVA